MTAHIDKGEPKLSGDLESETKRSHRMSRMCWVMLTHAFRPGCLYTMELPTNYCNVLPVQVSGEPSEIHWQCCCSAQGDGIATKVEIDEERRSKTLSCFSLEISRGYI